MEIVLIMKADYLLFRIAIATILLCSISLGGLDQSGNSGAEKLTISEFNALVPASSLEGAFVDTGAPLAASEIAGTEIATYTEKPPSITDLKTLMPSAVLKSPPRYMYFNGEYLAWNDFATTFPSSNPGLWIERAVSWTLYATMPWGGWTRELIYVPQASPVTMYEIYPGGYVLGYSLGLVQSGFYYIWYYADSPGRHRNLFTTNSGYSNAVVIDVYSPAPPKPVPDPKKECEARSSDTQTCEWRDGRCQCIMKPAPNPVADCESNPLCDYVNGHCYCRGLNPEPMPGPVPNPNPEPGPFNPAPNPVADCPDGCYWSNGGCRCMGLGSGSGNSNSGGGDEDLMTAE